MYSTMTTFINWISSAFIWLARPNNIWSSAVNEKIYIFLWFWFLLLGFLTILVVFYRILIVFSPRIRVTTYQWRFVPQLLFILRDIFFAKDWIWISQAYLLYIRFRLVKKECINIIIKKTKMGDWFLLYMLGLNIDSIIFKEVVHELARKLGYHNKDIYES